MIENRIARRTDVRLDATVATVVTSGPAIVTDLSETGAKILYSGARQGERVSLVALGQDICGTVAWADPDRFGMKFDQRLCAGPLHGFTERFITPRAQVRPIPVATRVFGRKAA